MGVHELSRIDARRVAVRAQLLDDARPADLLSVARGLTMLQHDATAAVAPNADLVAWSRLGSAYSAAELTAAMQGRTLIDLFGMIRPAADVALYRANMDRWRMGTELTGWRKARNDWVMANDAFRRYILDRLDGEGPLTARDFPDAVSVPFRSSGWNDNRNVTMMLELMVSRGEIAFSERRGRDRYWDLASRVYPDVAAVPVNEARRRRDERRLRSLGLARAKGPECQVEPLDVGEAGEPAVIDGVKGEWRIDPSLLDQPFTARAALLSPLDRLVFDRKRTKEIFEFDYQLEMYKPANKRRWGYWALPILYGDRLVGKLDASADRKAGVFRVDAIYQDMPFSKTMTAVIHREIKDLARWLELELVLPR